MRYALYFTPPIDDPLTRIAARWLGRDAFTGDSLPAQLSDGLDIETWRTITADPRRYGFHATLKAPFELMPGRSEAELLQTLDEFSAELEPFSIDRLVLSQLGPFFALVPDSDCPPLQALADATVRRFEPFRAPLSASDIERRKPQSLPVRQRDNLMNWGYPYVFGDFQFHMTLTGPVDDAGAPRVRQILEDIHAPFIGRPLTIDGIALFVEPERGAPFIVHSLLRFATDVSDDRKTV